MRVLSCLVCSDPASRRCSTGIPWFPPTKKDRGLVASLQSGLPGADRKAGRRARKANLPCWPACVATFTVIRLRATVWIFRPDPVPKDRTSLQNPRIPVPGPLDNSVIGCWPFKAGLERELNPLPTDYKSVALPNELSNGAVEWN